MCLRPATPLGGLFMELNLRGSWVARGIVQYQKNFKRQSLSGTVLPDVRDQKKKKSCHDPGLLFAQPKVVSLCLSIPLLGWGLAVL